MAYLRLKEGLLRLAKKSTTATTARAARFNDKGYFKFSLRVGKDDNVDIAERMGGSRNPRTLVTPARN